MVVNSFDSIIGPILIGVIVSAIIFGISCLQAYLYYNEYCLRDGFKLKSLAVLIMLLDCVHLGLLVHAVYYYTVSNFGHSAVLIRAVWSLLVQLPIAGVTGIFVQLFFAHRLFRLSGNKFLLPLLIAMLGMTQLTFTTIYMIKGFSVELFQLNGDLSIWYSTAMYASIACDALITISTTYYLVRSRKGSRGTITAVNYMIAYTLNTGLLTTLFIGVTLVTFRMFPSSMISAPFYFVSTRLYCCSFLSILNSRDSIRKKLSGSTDGLVAYDDLVMKPKQIDDYDAGPSFGNVGHLPDNLIKPLPEAISAIPGSGFGRFPARYSETYWKSPNTTLVGSGVAI